MSDDTALTDSGPTNFIRERIEADIAAGKHGGVVATRFPPEPNGYLHIGHAKAISVDFGLAAEFGGTCNLRMDDTNPTKEESRYVEAIAADVRWLGYEWNGEIRYASDYFEQLYEWAEVLVKNGDAYVDSQSIEEIRKNRGNFYSPGVDSPYRDRPVDESLQLLREMRAGELAEGEAVLRAKIDMQHKNLNMRDPLIYRILEQHHHRTGDDWCIYPMYDYAHGLSDAIEGITHSICTLEFEDHRPLYDWFIDKLPTPAEPEQIEFARLKMSYTMMSKRKLLELVKSGAVAGWDDPRMPTLSAMRRLGYPPAAILRFCERIGVAKRDGVVDVGLLEHAVREELNAVAPRRMGVLDPLKLVITNYPEGETETFEAINNPENDSAGTRPVPFSRELWVERGDFREDAPKKWYRLAPGREVRLRAACLVTCDEVIKDEAGEVIELRCSWDPESRGGKSPDGRKVRGTLHWVSAQHAVDAEVRLYDRLFSVESPEGPGDLNPESLEIKTGCKLEPSLDGAEPGYSFQLERLGYFCVDPDSSSGALVLNRTITLRDSWARLEKKMGGGK
jgi:glutaminyl-tRNA synthetase